MRTTNDKKGKRVVVRLNDEDNIYLREMSSRQGMNISDYVRKMIERDRLSRMSSRQADDNLDGLSITANIFQKKN